MELDKNRNKVWGIFLILGFFSVISGVGS